MKHSLRHCRFAWEKQDKAAGGDEFVKLHEKGGMILKASIKLCDSVQVVDGKLYILGGGWELRLNSELAATATFFAEKGNMKDSSQ